MAFPQSFLDELTARNDILDVVGRDKLDLVKDFCQWPVNYIQGLIG